jgi:hypothetical protein
MPLCGQRTGWADHDHVIAHSAGGPTTCTNLCCLCRGCHRLKTLFKGWLFAIEPDGTLHVTTPSGVTRTSRPPGLRRRPPPPDDDPPPFWQLALLSSLLQMRARRRALLAWMSWQAAVPSAWPKSWRSTI